MFQIYKMVWKHFIPPNESVAYGHAKDILHLEERLRLMFEFDPQRWVLDQGDWLIKSFNNVYAYYRASSLACYSWP